MSNIWSFPIEQIKIRLLFFSVLKNAVPLSQETVAKDHRTEKQNYKLLEKKAQVYRDFFHSGIMGKTFTKGPSVKKIKIW